MKELDIERLIHGKRFDEDIRGKLGIGYSEYRRLDASERILTLKSLKADVGDDLERDAMTISMMMAEDWDGTGRAFVFDETLLDEFLTTGDETIPVSALDRLPYKCLYIKLPKRTVQEIRIDGEAIGPTEGELIICGVLASVREDPERPAGSIIMLMPVYEQHLRQVDGSRSATYLTHTVGMTSIDRLQSFKSAADRLARLSMIPDGTSAGGFTYTTVRETAAAADALTMTFGALKYLCDPRVRPDRVTEPSGSPQRRAKKHLTSATVYEMGTEVGRALRLQRDDCARAQREWDAAHAAGGAGARGEGRAAPRPHIRRAHWHGYWTGPRGDPTGLVIHWIPPTPVGFELSDGRAAATLQRVLPPEGGPEPARSGER